MDPISIWIFCFAAAWFIRALVEDGVAQLRGHDESPRIARRRARQQLAHQHLAVTGQPTIGQAVAGRVADRIANPPRELGPARQYLTGLWEDSWEDATTRREDRRRKREDRRREQAEREREQAERDAAGRPDPDNAVRARPCLGRCGVLVTGPREWCDDCKDPAADQDDPELDDVQVEERNRDDISRREDRGSWYCANRCGRPVPERADWCPACMATLLPGQQNDFDGDCDGDDDFPDTDATATETPEPTPAPDTTRKDTPPMSTPADINGDASSPLETLAFATGCLDLNKSIMNELDAMANNLDGMGVGNECVQIIRDAWAAAEQFDAAAAGARGEFVRHVLVQATIAGNTGLSNTVRDTYLDTARA